MWPWRKRISATIGNGVRIRGRVEAEGDLDLAGEVHGDVSVAGTLVLRRTAKLYGDIWCETLQIEQGAVFAGTNRMGDGGTLALPAPAQAMAPSHAPAPPFNATQASGPAFAGAAAFDTARASTFAPASTFTPASTFAPAPPQAQNHTPAETPTEAAEGPLAILMAPVGTEEREMLGVMPKAESPAFYGGFNSAIKGA